jgi:DNA invertase Pin-like site-specific DNA recombinase
MVRNELSELVVNNGRPSKPGYGEMENEKRSENVRLGQARARAQGKEIGRPREVANDVKQRILTLRSAGHGYKAISQASGVPRSTVRRPEGGQNGAENSAAKSRAINSRRCGFVRGHKWLFLAPKI